jgi:dihydroorotate dehydrogenase
MGINSHELSRNWPMGIKVSTALHAHVAAVVAAAVAAGAAVVVCDNTQPKRESVSWLKHWSLESISVLNSIQY